MLNKHASKLAVRLIAEGAAVGVLITSYTLGTPVDPLEGQKALIASLNDARAMKGKPPAQWVTNPPEFYVRSATALLANQTSPEDVLGEFMDETVRITRRPLRGYSQRVIDLAEVDWPPDVLEHPAPQVLLFIGVQRAEGEAWGGYVVLLLILEGAAGGQQA